jgi:hypothetical protein
MNATNPIQIDGKTYDRYSLNLAITGKYHADGATDAQVAMRLIPTRIADGAVETADSAALGISLGMLAGSDQATQTAVAAIQAALQTYLQAKGL